MVTSANKIKKILIAYDGSGYSRAALNELQYSGLPTKAEAIIISVSEIWLQLSYEDTENIGDPDVSEYYEKHRAQTGRDLAETKAISIPAKKPIKTNEAKKIPSSAIQSIV